jgi:hypothetical protein
MQGTARTRAASAIGFGALAGCFALAAPAHAIPPTPITHSEITSPQGTFFSVFDTSAPSNPKFTFSGTSDGDASDTVDIRCYVGGPAYNTVAANVPVAADGTFTSGPVDLGAAGATLCRFRAVQTGTNPTDLSSFSGPTAGVSRTGASAISGGPNDGTQYDFFADLWQRAGDVQYNGASNCAISAMSVMTPLSRQSSGQAWACSAALQASAPNANPPGHSEVEVDGRQAYGSYAADGLFSGGPNSYDNSGFPALTSAVAQDAQTGDGTITESERFVTCPDAPGNFPATGANCSPSFAASGVQLTRTLNQSDDGRTVTVTDSWKSTDGSPHQLRLHYDNGENSCCGDPRWAWPGQEATAFAAGDIVDGPFGAPDSMLGQVSGTASPSTAYPAFALTWDTAPSRARYYGGGGCCPPPSAMRFLLDYDNVAVPATGEKVLRFAYSADSSAAGADRRATHVRDLWGAPTVTITAPANGATLNAASVSVGGKALDNVGIASLVVNGMSVTPAADGTYSVPVALTPGPNTLTATVKDAAGNTAAASETVTYSPPRVAPPPACVVPSVKRGGTVGAAKRLLAKAHCAAGKTSTKHSSTVKKGRVIGLAKKAGGSYAAGTKVGIVVSSGRKKKH